MAGSSQKFIARNRAPRVQIEYDVEVYGAEKKVQLPFVMGVMSDLAGKSEEPQPAIADRKFLEIDVDTFDDRMKAMRPRVAFTVPNTLTGEGNLAVDLTFQGMDDFTPAAIARRVEPLRVLFEARTQLSNLLTYMDGKSSAEALIEQVLQDPALLTALADTPHPGLAGTAPPDEGAPGGVATPEVPPPEQADDSATALEALRRVAPAPSPTDDGPAAILEALRIATPQAASAHDTAAGTLAALRMAAPSVAAVEDGTAAALDALRIAAPQAQPEADATGDALAALRSAPPVVVAADDGGAKILDTLRMAEPENEPEPDATGDALAALRGAAPVVVAVDSGGAAALDALRMAAPVAAPEADATGDALAALRSAPPVVVAADDGGAKILDTLRMAAAVAAPEPDTTDDALAVLRGAPAAVVAVDSGGAAALDALRMSAPVAAPELDATEDALAALRGAPAAVVAVDSGGAEVLDALRMAAAVAAPEPDTTDDALAALRSAAPVLVTVDNGSTAALDALRMAAPVPDATDDAFAALRSAAPVVVAADDGGAAALDALRMALPDTVALEDGNRVALDALRAVVPDVVGDRSDGDALASLLDAVAERTPEPEPDDPLAILRDAPVSTFARVDEARGALDALRMVVPVAELAADPAALALSALRQAATREAEPATVSETAFDALRMAPQQQHDADDMAAVPLSALLGAIPEAVNQPDAATTALDALRVVTAQNVSAPRGDDPLADLDAFLSLVAEADPLAGLDDLLTPARPEDAPLADLDAFLSPVAEADPLAGLDDLLTPTPPGDDLLADLDALRSPAVEADPLAGLDDLLTPARPEDDPLADLDALLSPVVEADPLAGLDDLLSPQLPHDDPLVGLEALLAEPISAITDDDDPLAGLEALLAGPAQSAAAKEDALTNLDDILAAPKPKARPVSGFGRITAPAPSPERLYRPAFRIAILGDFTGRAARGEVAIGEAMARRRPILLDVDTVEDVIDDLATTLVLPIGPEGRGIAVPLKGLDSLHPDELVRNVEVFDALNSLRQRLSTPSMAAKAVAEMQGWGSAHGTVVQPTASRSAASAVPVDLRLSDFQRLIGDREGKLSTPSPVADLIGQIVGPYVVPGPNPEARALRGTVDEAMSHAMRLILHHPEFQAIEAQWRTLDLLARRIETDGKLELVLYDISAEEIAADLTAGEDLSKSGLYRLLNAPLQDEGAVGFSAMFGLYAFEETPPHAALLGRVGAIAGHLQLPFFTSMTAGFLDTAKRDRHPLVTKAWDALRRDPAAAWLGLASPRFLLRRPYGASSEPVDAFDFEEFTLSEGLSGMLWANPVALVAVLLAEAWNKGRGKMVLGKTMSMGDMPYHIVEDQHGDQVALPCTERNVTAEKSEIAVSRGFMPVVSIRGRDVVRLASFQSLAGTEIAGPWMSEPPVRSPDDEGESFRADVPVASDAAAQSMEDELDALLAGFGASAAPVDPGAIDADLAALLEGL